MMDFNTVEGRMSLLAPFSKITPGSAIYQRLSTFKSEYIHDRSFGLLVFELLFNNISIEIFIQDMRKMLESSDFFDLIDIKVTPQLTSYDIEISYKAKDLLTNQQGGAIEIANFSLNTAFNGPSIVLTATHAG